MARLEDRSLGRLYLALIAVGAVAGGLVAAGTVVADWARGRRT
jgi:hypothetical protein